MFIKKGRVEEDLERIRRANLPAEVLACEDAVKKAESDAIKEKAKDVAPKQIFAMTLAALSVLMPYIGLIALILLGFWVIVKCMAG